MLKSRSLVSLLAGCGALAACGSPTGQLEGWWALESMANMDCAGHLEDMGIKMAGGDENFVALSMAGRVMNKFEGLTATTEDDGTIMLASDRVTFRFRQDGPDRLTLVSGPSGHEHNTLRRQPTELVRCP